MRKESFLRIKSYAFALKVVKLYQQLLSEKKEYILSKQLLKSGTAPGALIRESEYAQSSPDFISKYSIALKEVNEADYWITLLRDSGYISSETAEELIAENNELLRMLISSINTLKEKIRQEKIK
jgi:four helix bundle protein